MRNEIIDLLKSCKKNNMDNLIKWLENESDYFTAPASIWEDLTNP
jgi:hypothetical protein